MPPGKIKGTTLRRNALASLQGVTGEASKIYRKMKTNKIDHEKGRSLVWVLAQIRAMIEAETLQRIEQRLEKFVAAEGQASTLYQNGEDTDEPMRLLIEHERPN